MRVLQVGKYYPPAPGGIETFCADLHRALLDSGLDAHVIAHRQGRHGATPADPRVSLVRAFGELFFTPLAPSFRGRLKRLCRRLKPDIIHFHLPNPSAFWALTIRELRAIPWLIQWHSDVVASATQWRLRLSYPLYAPWERMMLNRGSRILVSSRTYLDASAPLAPYYERCVVVPLGIDPDRLTMPANAPVSPWKDGLFRVLAIGRLTYYKGFELLIEALARMPDAQLIIVGSGTREADLRKACAQHAVADRVEIRSRVDDAERNALLAGCHCLCLPSIERTEAFGLVLVEAMALGKPVVATDLPGSAMPEVVRRGGHGLLATPGSAADLAAQLRRLAQDRRLLRDLGDRGRENFQQHFHIRHTAARMAQLYATAAAQVARAAGGDSAR